VPNFFTALIFAEMLLLGSGDPAGSPTEETMRKCKLFLDCMAHEPEMILTYHASDMVLAVHSDASYLSKPGARSRAGGHFFMSAKVEDPPNNGAVLNVSKIIDTVM
jgi:hypothetical protein